MDRTALFSSCGRFRYRLGWRWGEGPTVAFVLLNPSSADAQVDDPTVRRCIDFARRLGFGGLEVVNLYAYVATDPGDLRRAGYLVGPENDRHIIEAVAEREKVVLAWGVHAGRRERPGKVLRVLRDAGVVPYCLRVTGSGHPEHPLRLPKGCGLQPFDLRRSACRRSWHASIPTRVPTRRCKPPAFDAP
jgi:hypothetical protein